VFEADGKTPGINSDKTAAVIEWYKELYRDAMEPEVLSWDDAANNQYLASGKGCKRSGDQRRYGGDCPNPVT